MTDKGPGSADEWINGDVLNADDLLDSMAQLKWIPVIYNGGNVIAGIIAHSSTTYSMIENGDSDIHQTSTSGTTWTSRNTDLDTSVSFIRVCEADKTRGIAVETGTTCETAFTSDSGGTWTTTASVSFGTNISDVAFPVTALIVAVGDDAAGTGHIQFSDDSGATWADVDTQPPGASLIRGVSMFDGATGYAVDGANPGNIYTSTDMDQAASRDWSDTTDNLSEPGSIAVGDASMVCLSASSVVIAYVASSVAVIDTYNNSTNTVTQRARLNAYDMPIGIIQTTSGNIYTGFVDFDESILVLKSTDSGVSWRMMNLPIQDSLTDSPAQKCRLAEAANDEVLLIHENSIIMRLPEDD